MPEIKIKTEDGRVLTILAKDGVNGLNGKDGDKGDKGDTGEQGIPGINGKDGLNGKDGTDGLNGTDGKNGLNGSPDTVEDIVSKLQGVKKEWLSIDAIKGDFNTRIRNIAKTVTGISSLKHLTDVDYSGLTQDANGNYILGSGGGGGGSFASLTGDPYDNVNLTTALDAKQDDITLTTTGSSGASTFIANTLNIPNYTLAGLGMAFGTTTQIPYMNAGGTAFIYSSGLTYNGSIFGATGEIIATGALKGDSVQLANNKAIYFKKTDGSSDSYFYRDGSNNVEMYNGAGFHILDATSGTKVATGLYPKTNDSAPIGSTSLMWSDLFLANGSVINWNAGDITLTHSANLLTLAGGNMNVAGTLSSDSMGISSLKAVFGERFLFVNEFSDVLWRADKRFTVTSSNGYSVATLFRGGFENTYTIPVSTTEVVNINFANQSGVPAGGVTYPEGKFYVHFYYTNCNYSAISARTKMNGVWYALGSPTDISTVAGDKVLEFQVSSNNYLTDIELTITTNGSDSVLVSALNYVCQRWTTELELPYFDKFATTNKILGNIVFRTVAQTNSGGINADGDWYLGTGGTGGGLGIGTSTLGTYKLNVVGNVLGNSIYTNSGEIFGSLGIAYLRGASSNGVYINDSGAGDVWLAGGGGKVGINEQYPTTKLHIKSASATASANVLNVDGGAVGFSGTNDAGTAYSLIFSACSYQTSIKQNIGAKIEMAKENTWNYADTPTGIKGTLNFYTSSGTPDSPTLTKQMSINSAGLITTTAGMYVGTTMELGHASDTTLSRVSAGVIAVEGVTIPTISSTSTLTNKRITKRVVTTTDDATAEIDVDITDDYELTAIANNTTFTVTGTPTDGQTLFIRLKDAGVSKTLTWTMSGGVIGVTLPTATTAGKWHIIGFKYFTSTTSWKAIAVGLEA